MFISNLVFIVRDIYWLLSDDDSIEIPCSGCVVGQDNSTRRECAPWLQEYEHKVSLFGGKCVSFNPVQSRFFVRFVDSKYLPPQIPE